MKAWYKEKYIDRRTWLLMNTGKLGLTPQQFLIASLIDLMNESRESVDINTLAKAGGMTVEETDAAVAQMVEKGWLKLAVKDRGIRFNIDRIYEQQEVIPEQMDVLPLFEKEFGRTLNPKEISRLVDWTESYSEDEIISALREASIYHKLSMNYIEKVLGKAHDKDGE